MGFTAHFLDDLLRLFQLLARARDQDHLGAGRGQLLGAFAGVGLDASVEGALLLVTGTTESQEQDQQQGELLEAVLSYSSRLVGKSLKQIRFRHEYDAVVIAVSYDTGLRDIEQVPVTIQVKEADGSLTEETRTLYRSHYGPMLVLTTSVSGSPPVAASSAAASPPAPASSV